MRKPIFITLLIFMAVAPVTFSASPDGRKYQYNDDRLGERADVSNKFTFARIMFGEFHSGWPIGDRGMMWSHDYPEAGLHFSKILSEVSKIPINLDMNEYIFRFDDPDLFKYPFAYLCEVGDLDLTDEEVAGMREYLLRGGFLLVDDFRGSWSMQNFANYVKRALPEHEIKELDVSHPIFNCFFSIKSLDDTRSYGRYRPMYFGVEDKNGRLMMIINYNNDVSDYWQWSNNPFSPIEDTNTAYKFGVNYVFYAITH